MKMIISTFAALALTNALPNKFGHDSSMESSIDLSALAREYELLFEDLVKDMNMMSTVEGNRRKRDTVGLEYGTDAGWCGIFNQWCLDSSAQGLTDLANNYKVLFENLAGDMHSLSTAEGRTGKTVRRKRETAGAESSVDASNVGPAEERSADAAPCYVFCW